MPLRQRLFLSLSILLLLLDTYLPDLIEAQQQQPQQQESQDSKKEVAPANTMTLDTALAAANSIKPLIKALAPNIAPTSATATGLQKLPVAPAAASSTQSKRPMEQSSVSFSVGNEDPIKYLDYSSMNDEILKKKTANFVYFNANFNQCRHCHKFFTIWKELAVDIRWWQQVVRLFAINCSDEDNIDMCRRAGVHQFPQVKFYWIMSNSLDQDGQRLRILGKSVHAMRHLIMDKVLDSYVDHNKILAQRAQQSRLPFSNGLSNFGGSISTSAQNPLTSLMGPLISQISNSAGSTGGGLASIMGSLIGKGGTTGVGMSNILGNLNGVEGVSSLISAVIGAGSSPRQKLINQPIPENWPDMDPIDVTDTPKLLDTLPLNPSKNIGALLIMETQEFLYTGLEVMLDLNPYGNQTYIARVRDERSQLTKNLTKRDDIQAPALIYVGANKEIKLIMIAPKYTNDEDLRRAFVKTFERKQVKYPVKRVWSAQIQVPRAADSQEDEEILEKIHQVYMSDLLNAIRTSLMEQVFRHPDLSDDQYNALVKYVYTIINYFPFNNDEILKFFKRLHSWLQNQVSPMDIDEYKKQFHDIGDIIKRREWIACKSLSNTKAIPTTGKKSGSLFENPAQFGKVVSNITRIFRGHQQQAKQLKNLFSTFTSNIAPVILNQQQRGQQTMSTNSTTNSGDTTQSPATSSSSSSSSSGSAKPDSHSGSNNRDESPIEHIIKSLTSGSMGSDSSILKLISTALTGGTSDDTGSSGKSKFAREYPCGIWKLAHVMVANEYIKDSPRKDVKHVVLHSLYQYMLHFYACPTCGNRVSDVNNEFRINLDEQLQDQGDSIMLLWKIHNRVSKRLESENRPGLAPKIQFPSESICPKCRAARTQTDLVTTPHWHDKQVLNFLVHHFRPQNIISNTNSSSSTSHSTLNLTTLHSFLLAICLCLKLFKHRTIAYCV